jgi:putative SOS response-associated peptidase YedK
MKRDAQRAIDYRPLCGRFTASFEFREIKLLFNLQRDRCLIPANGFYEWRREGNHKVRVWIHLKKKEPFAFAGLWDMWRDEGEVLYTFTIITTVPNRLMRRIHNRMPVIFDALQAKPWLDPRLSTREADIAAVLAPFHPS